MMTTTKEWTRFGSVSTGTLLAEDLIPAFIDELTSLLEDVANDCPPGSEVATAAYVDRCNTRMGEIERTMGEDADGFGDDESIGWLIDTLQENAADYVTFGSHEGDGADFGWWADGDAIDRDQYDDLLVRSDDTPDDAPEDPDLNRWVHVNDHENMTLYAWDGASWAIVWAIV